MIAGPTAYAFGAQHARITSFDIKTVSISWVVVDLNVIKEGDGLVDIDVLLDRKIINRIKEERVQVVVSIVGGTLYCSWRDSAPASRTIATFRKAI